MLKQQQQQRRVPHARASGEAPAAVGTTANPGRLSTERTQIKMLDPTGRVRQQLVRQPLATQQQRRGAVGPQHAGAAARSNDPRGQLPLGDRSKPPLKHASQKAHEEAMQAAAAEASAARAAAEARRQDASRAAKYEAENLQHRMKMLNMTHASADDPNVLNWQIASSIRQRPSENNLCLNNWFQLGNLSETNKVYITYTALEFDTESPICLTFHSYLTR